MAEYKCLQIIQSTPNSSIFYLYLNRPSLKNALSGDFFIEFPKALSSLDQNPNVRVIILAGQGTHFCSGIDLKTLNSITNSQTNDQGRVRERVRREIKGLQDAISAIEKCRKPVIVSVHGGCIGGGIDIITACDIRYCTEDAFFTVKEVDLGITADLGTLQRLPRIVGYGNAIELALTARRFSGLEAKSLGLVSRVFGNKEVMDEEVRAVAEEGRARLRVGWTYTGGIIGGGGAVTGDGGVVLEIGDSKLVGGDIDGVGLLSSASGR
ncbi:hypothetical protein IFM89_031164 [Coptis chinensis]|uniref:Uncharacterized protein n=1 Tax=Coptis chinensis TaxID=261450 RepID=A0A835MFZ3_9MAGN|nr:hypothetical protein IFM89_031164 [Coptis chinensis]